VPIFRPELVMGIHAINAKREGIRLMLQKLPFLSRFLSKLLFELLPAAIASAVGGMLFSHYAYPPVVTPAVAIETPTSVEMMKMVRDEHALIVNYLQKYTEARQQLDLAAEQDMLRSKAVERAAMLAASEAKTAEVRVLASAVRVGAKSEWKVAANRPAHDLDKATVGQPLEIVRLASIATQMQPVVQPPGPPAKLMTSVGGSDENTVKTKLREITATAERVSFWVRSVAEWLSDEVPTRPLTRLPERQILKVWM
jgi:hypothetical protein